MINFRHAQTKAHEELDRVVGRDSSRLPTLDMKDDLHYVNALVNEVMRCSNVTPFAGMSKLPCTIFVYFCVPILVRHVAIEDTWFRGYFFPKGTEIMPILVEIHQDPKNFADPEKFSPERFLDSNGMFVQHPAMVAFGVGKRECLGKSLAKQEAFLFTACLLHRVNVEMLNFEKKCL